jgi:hypothetical protein
MNWLKSELVKAILRHALSGAGVWLVNKGYLTDDAPDKIYGALAVLVAVAHSLWDKRVQIAADFKALFEGGDTPKATVLVALLLPLVLVAGCAGTQVANHESGTGVKLKLPIGYAGNNVAEVDMTVGLFKSTTVTQPVSTNHLFSPSLVVASSDGGVVQSTLSTPTGTGTNLAAGGTTTISGGDSDVLTTGDAIMSMTNWSTVSTHGFEPRGGTLVSTNHP